MEELDEEIDSLFVDIDDKGLIEGLDDDETLILDHFLPEEMEDNRKRTWSDMDSAPTKECCTHCCIHC